MIKANELRIGNWVNCYLGSPVQIEEIGKIEYRSGSLFNYKTSKPIPLTPEILEKCGLLGNEVFTDVEYFSVKENSLYFRGEYTAAEEVKYIHQLQNLYFALTGSELTIKL